MKALLISLPAAANDNTLVHRFRNFAEDIYREFTPAGVADVPDMDSAVTELHVTISATRHLRTVTTFVTKTLRHHNLSELASVSRLDSYQNDAPTR